MAWSLVGSDGVGFADGNAGHVYAVPAGAPSAGDLDVLMVNSNTVVTTPSGFSVARSRVNSQGSYIYYRFAAGGESANITITTSGDHPTDLLWSRWTGGSAFDVAADAGVDGVAGTTTPAVNSGAIAQAASLSLAFAALHSGTGQTSPVWSSGYTALAEATNGTGSTGVTAYGGYNTNAGTAAETPNVSWTTNASDRYILVAVFSPAAGGGNVDIDATRSTTATITPTAAVDRPATSTLIATATVTPTAAVDRAATAAITTTAAITVAASVDRAASATLTITATRTVTAEQPAAHATSTAAVTAGRTSTDAVAANRTSTPGVT